MGLSEPTRSRAGFAARDEYVDKAEGEIIELFKQVEVIEPYPGPYPIRSAE